jgi:hypothetical protein
MSNFLVTQNFPGNPNAQSSTTRVPYPRPGTPNPHVKALVRNTKQSQLQSLEVIDELVVAVSWSNTGESLLIITSNRDQTRQRWSVCAWNDGGDAIGWTTVYSSVAKMGWLDPPGMIVWISSSEFW